jgi:hypothetical protein
MDMNCPVCGADANDVTATADNTSVVCAACGEYEISSSVLAGEQWLSLEAKERRDLLDDARRSAEPGMRPVIANYAPPEQPPAG